jgi:hypothetical protein
MVAIRFATPADDALLASICEHDQVRPACVQDGATPAFEPARYTAHAKSRAVLAFDDAGQALGAWLMCALEQDAYGIHTNLLPSCRGRRAIETATAALQFCFIHTDAMQLWTCVPGCNRPAAWFAHHMGFRDEFTRAHVWLKDGQRWDMTYMRMDVDHWIQGSQAMQEVGERFHELRAAHGTPPNHGHDPIHDRYAGAAWMFIEAGQFDKAHHVYNRWARACGYQPLQYLSFEPLRIDIGDAVIHIDADAVSFEEKTHA